jgi:hypothetical protein
MLSQSPLPPWRAAETLSEILRHPSPAQAVAQRFAEMEALIPALLTLNAQQARHAGRNDLVGALAALLDHMAPETYQMPITSKAPGVAVAPSSAQIAFVSPSPEIETIPLAALRNLGHRVSIGAEAAQHADIVILHQPQADPAATQSVLEAGRPILLYLDADYARMPSRHPGYARLGLNTPERITAYTAALTHASVVGVAGRTLGNRLREAGHIVEVLWPAWQCNNPLWTRPAPRRSALYLGWFAACGDVDALLALKRVLARLTRELPDVVMVVVGEPAAFQELSRALPQHRRLLLPPVTAAERPHTLSHLDVLLLPHHDNAFNRALSDQFLMEAGVRRVPWVASPLPAVEEWHAGGLIAHDADEWYAHLRRLCLEPAMRAKLGEAGWQLAQQREAAQLVANWQRLIQNMLSQSEPLPALRAGISTTEFAQPSSS